MRHPTGKGKFDLAAGLWGTCIGDEIGQGGEKKKKNLSAFAGGNNSVFLFKSWIFIHIYIHEYIY